MCHQSRTGRNSLGMLFGSVHAGTGADTLNQMWPCRRLTLYHACVADCCDHAISRAEPAAWQSLRSMCRFQEHSGICLLPVTVASKGRMLSLSSWIRLNSPISSTSLLYVDFLAVLAIRKSASYTRIPLLAASYRWRSDFVGAMAWPFFVLRALFPMWAMAHDQPAVWHVVLAFPGRSDSTYSGILDAVKQGSRERSWCLQLSDICQDGATS